MRRLVIFIALVAGSAGFVAGVVWPALDDGKKRPSSGDPEAQTDPLPPLSASVTMTDLNAGMGRIEWEVGPTVRPTSGAEIVAYEVEALVDGRSLSDEPTEYVDPFVEVPLWDAFGRWDADVEFVLRVQARFDDGSLSGPLTRRLVLPAVVPPALEWKVGPPELLVENPRASLGLDMWVDGSIGFAPVDGGIRAFGANGPRGAVWDVGSDEFVEQVLDPSLEIEGQSDFYAAGGPVYVHDGDPTNLSDDRIVMIYHGEDHRQAGADPRLWRGYLGMAISADNGRTFVDAGRIVAPDLPDTEPLESGIEIGGGAYAIVSDDGVSYLYVYFRDTFEDGTNVKLAVARAPVAAVEAAAAACTPAEPTTCVAPEFHKFGGAGWSEPGVDEVGLSGGTPTDLFGSMGYTPTPVWFDVVHMPSRQMYVMVMSWFVSSDVPALQEIDGWSYAVSTSEDGLEWSRPRRLIDTEPFDELAYVTVTSADLRSPRVAETDALAIYRTRTEMHEPGPPGRWSGDVFIERIPISLDHPPAAADRPRG